MYSKECYMRKIENREIDIMEMLKYVLRQWKKVVIFIFVIFVLMLSVKGYSYQINKTKQITLTVEQLGDASMQKVEDIIKLKEKLYKFEEYKKNSAYMNINPMNSKVITLQYFITASNEDYVNAIYDLYANYIDQGSFKEQLSKKMETKIDNPADLISVVEPYKISEEKKTEKRVLCIRINVPDETDGQEIAEAVKEGLANYQIDTVSKVVGKHDLRFISESNYTELDEHVRAVQNDLEKMINETKTQIANAESQLTNLERAALQQKITGVESEVADAESSNVFSLKFLALALVVSIFVVIGMYSVYYLINNKLKSAKEMSEIFDIPYVEWNKRESGDDKQEIVRKELEFLCEIRDVKDVFVSCLDKSVERKCLESVFSEISGIEFVVGYNIYDSKFDLEMAKKHKNVILVVRPDRTSYDNIVKLLSKCEYLGIRIIGAVSME